MFDLIAAWFAAGMFVAGSWIILGSFRPVPVGPRGGAGRVRRRPETNFSPGDP